jgi:hypothetical protein
MNRHADRHGNAAARRLSRKNSLGLCKNTSALASQRDAFTLCIGYGIYTVIVDLAQLLNPTFKLHCLRIRHLV